jgi:hypothetical protein
MGKSKPSAPAPVIVNPTQSATGQASFNKEAALQQRALNMVDQYTPQGSTTYEATGTETEGIPGMKVTQTLSPEQQGLYDTSNRLAQKYGDIGETQLGAVQSKLETPFSLESLGAAPTFDDAYRTQQKNNLMTRLQPQFDQRRGALETQLANQGFVPGTQAYNTAMDEYNRSYNDALIQADIQSTGIAGQQYGLETTDRDRAINEMLMQRQQPLAELSAFMSGSQPTMPGFIAAPQGQIAAPDLQGMQLAAANAQNSANQNAYNQQMGTYNANMQGLYGLGGAGLKAAGYAWSDRRLKRDVEKIGKLENGLNVYSFRYLWDDKHTVGLMADEVKAIHPTAVINVGGYDAVNYAEAVR